MASIPRAVKLARETADCLDQCDTIINQLSRMVEGSGMHNGATAMAIAHVNAAIEYASRQGITVPLPTCGDTVESANAEMLAKTEKLAALCGSAILQLSILRDMCGETKKAIIGGEPAAQSAHTVHTAPTAQAAHIAPTDGACVTVCWTTGNTYPSATAQIIPNLFVWDDAKKTYLLNILGRGKNTYTAQCSRTSDSLSSIFGGNIYTIRWTNNGSVAGCTVRNRESDVQDNIDCTFIMEPIKWRPVDFRKVFHRDQM